MKLQYREIVRAANRINRRFSRWEYGTPQNKLTCALGAVAISLIGVERFINEAVFAPGMTSKNLAKITGLDHEKLRHLEGGFEGWTVDMTGALNLKHPQYKIGQRLGKLVG